MTVVVVEHEFYDRAFSVAEYKNRQAARRGPAVRRASRADCRSPTGEDGAVSEGPQLRVPA
jgi:hypothetical protein